MRSKCLSKLVRPASLLAAGTAIFLMAALSIHAQQMPGMMGRGGMMGMMGGCPMMGEDGASLASLKSEIGITDAQSPAWQAYASVLKKMSDGMQSRRQAMMQVMQSGSPVERLDMRIAAMESGEGMLKELKPALTALYAALSDDQKKKADQLLGGGMGCFG